MNFHSRTFQLGLALLFALGLCLPMQKAGASAGSIPTSGADPNKTVTLSIAISNVFVDDDWVGLTNGTPVTVSGTSHSIGTDAFDTIQKGVNAVMAGGVVTVAAGTYTEQVTISKNAQLIGAGAGSSIIKAPASLPVASQATSAIIIINGGDVELTGFTVSGPGPSACGSIRAGIFVRDNAHANIHDNTVQDIRDNPFGGCQNGIAIAVGRNAWSTSGSADITNNTIVGYQKGGIVVDNAGSSANITGNTITGAGTVDITAQNGIQISRGATANLTGNTITGNSYHNDLNESNWGATGILIYQAGDVNLAGGNVISGNDQNLDKYGGSGLLTLGAEIFGGSSAPAGTGFDIVNDDPQSIDATGVTFTGAADGFAIENRVYHKVDDDSQGLVTWVAGNVYATAEGGSIQAAIDAANPGETVNVQAGNYIEAVTVDKPLTLLGPNAGVNPNTGSRSPEAVILPPAIGNDPNEGGTCYAMLTVDSDSVTVKGFTLDGNNPDLTSNYLVNGVDVDACEGIVGFNTVSNIEIENNIVKNTRYTGVDFDNTDGGATSSNYIRYNRLLNMGNDWGIGVLLYDNFYADVSYNFFDQVRVGVQTGNFYRSNPGSTASISHNDISSWRRGIFYNLNYSNASPFTVSTNTIHVIDSTLSSRWDGILITSFQDTANGFITNNTIVATDVHQTTIGYEAWNTPTSAALTISGGTVTGANYGVWVNNFQGYGPSNAANTAIALDNVSITGASIAGVFVQDDPLNTNGAHVSATINNSPIHNSAVGILVQGSEASATGMCNQISSNTAGLNNTTTAVLDFEKNWWGSASGPAGVGFGLGDSVSANVDYMPWNTDTTCTAFTSNNKPTANSVSISTDKNTSKAITLTGSDLEGSPLTFSLVTNPAHGTLSGTIPELTYTPATGFVGGDSFTFKIFDGTDYSAEATVSITVNAVNSDPVITGDSTVEVSMGMNGLAHPFLLTLDATDVDTSDILTWNIETDGTHGTASVSGDGTGASMVIHYVPDHNFHGTDTFVVQVADGNGGFDTVTVNVSVNATYSLPILFVPSVP